MVWKFSQVRVIGAQFVPREPKLVRVIGSFEKSRVREIGGEILELEWSKFNGNKVWFEISGCCYIEIWPLERSIRYSCAPLPSHMDISSRQQLSCSLMLNYRVFLPKFSNWLQFPEDTLQFKYHSSKGCWERNPIPSVAVHKRVLLKTGPTQTKFWPIKVHKINRQKGLHLRPRGRLSFSRVSV